MAQKCCPVNLLFEVSKFFAKGVNDMLLDYFDQDVSLRLISNMFSGLPGHLQIFQ